MKLLKISFSVLLIISMLINGCGMVPNKSTVKAASRGYELEETDYGINDLDVDALVLTITNDNTSIIETQISNLIIVKEFIDSTHVNISFVGPSGVLYTTELSSDDEWIAKITKTPRSYISLFRTNNGQLGWYSDCIYSVMNNKGKYDLINITTGKYYDYSFDSISPLHFREKDSVFEYKLNDKFGILDCHGEKLTEATYSSIIDIDDGVFIVSDGSKYGLVTLDRVYTGELLYNKCTYKISYGGNIIGTSDNNSKIALMTKLDGSQQIIFPKERVEIDISKNVKCLLGLDSAIVIEDEGEGTHAYYYDKKGKEHDLQKQGGNRSSARFCKDGIHFNYYTYNLIYDESIHNYVNEDGFFREFIANDDLDILYSYTTYLSAYSSEYSEDAEFYGDYGLIWYNKNRNTTFKIIDKTGKIICKLDVDAENLYGLPTLNYSSKYVMLQFKMGTTKKCYFISIQNGEVTEKEIDTNIELSDEYLINGEQCIYYVNEEKIENIDTGNSICGEIEEIVTDGIKNYIILETGALEYSLIDNNLNPILKGTYIQYFSDEFILVDSNIYDINCELKHEAWGVYRSVNQSDNNFLMKGKNKAASSVIYDENRYAFFSKSGEIALNNDYYYLSEYFDGVAYYAKESEDYGESECGVIDCNGNALISGSFRDRFVEEYRITDMYMGGNGIILAKDNNYYLYTWSSRADDAIEEEYYNNLKSYPTCNMTYLAMSELAYCNLKPTGNKTITEARDLSTYIKKVSTNEKNKKIPHTQYSLTYKEFAKNILDYVSDWKIVDIYDYTKTSGFYAALLERDNERVLAIRGSESLKTGLEIKDWFDTNNYDWVDNIIYGGTENVSLQMLDALKVADEIKVSSSGYSVKVTGHSLGGGLTMFLGNYLGIEAIGFDGSPTTDVSYYRLANDMSENYTGIDKWNSVDYINENCPVGALDKDIKNYVALKDRHNTNNILDAHHRWSITDYNDDKLELSPVVKNHSFDKTDIIRKDMNRLPALPLYKVYPTLIKYGSGTGLLVSYSLAKIDNYNRVFPAGTLVMGSSAGQQMFASLKLNTRHTDVMYGGDGNDVIYSYHGDDILIGGNGDDILDGGTGNDTYVYWKGQGFDTIVDASGNDTLILNGFDDDTITFDSDLIYIYVKANGKKIMQINKLRNNLIGTDSFVVEKRIKAQRGEQEEYESVKIEDWSLWKNVKTMTIACPTKVQIIDEDGNVVLELEDVLDEPIYTEYGQFYVNEEDGEIIKHLMVEDSYKVKIVATGDGKMSFNTYQEDDTTIQMKNVDDLDIIEGDVYDVEFENDYKLNKNGEEIELDEITEIKSTDIEVDSESLSVKVGDKQQIKANLLPQNSTDKLEYQSLDSNIVTVDEKGIVTAVGEGETIVSVFTEYGLTKNIVVNVGGELEDNNENDKELDNKDNESDITPIADPDKPESKDEPSINTDLPASEEKSSNISSNDKNTQTQLDKNKTDTSINTTKSVPTIKLKSVKNKKKKSIIIKWKWNVNADGYQIMYAKKKSFSGAKKKNVNAYKDSLTIKKLTKGKTYYVKIRSYVNDDSGNRVYGKWSSVKKVKIKK